MNRRYGEGPPDAVHYADLEPSSRLARRFLFVLDGQTYTYELRIRRVRRASLPRDFFSVRPMR